jgi:argininosuccinate lyase
LTEGVVRTLQVNAARMWAALEGGFCQATDLAEYVMLTCALDYRTAYQVVGLAVRTAHESGLRGIDLDGAMIDAAAQRYAGRSLGLAGTDLSGVLDPRRIVETRTAVGGAAPDVVEGMAVSCSKRAAELLGAASTSRAAFAAAENALLALASTVATGTDKADSDHAGPERERSDDR